MRDDCIRAVTEAAERAGKSLTAADLRDIESNIRQALRDNARDNPLAHRAQSPQQQVNLAAERVARQIVAERARAVQNVARQIIAHDRNQRFVDEHAGNGMRRTDAIERLLVNRLDNKADVKSLEQVREGIARTAKAKLEPIAQATQRYAGFWTDKNSVRDIVRELYGEKTNSAVARDVGKIWSDQIAEPLRQQFNESGGDVAKRGDWAIPQDHSQYKVARAFTNDWIDYTLQRLDRSEYVNTDGTPMNDVQVRAMLGEVRNTIATDGAWNTSPGQGGSALRNRGSDRRVLHFKDADSYLDYQQQFGERSLLETMVGHIDSMAKNIAALQTFGPSAEAGFKALLDDAVKRDVSAGADANKMRADRALLETRFALAAGKLGSSGNPTVAHNYQVIRTTLSATKLGGAAVSAITDGGNTVAVARSWNLPPIRSWLGAEMRSWSPEYRQFMRSQGVGVEAVTHSVSRFGEEVFGHGLSGNIANTIFRISGLNLLDNARRTGAGGMLMARLGELTREHATIDDTSLPVLQAAGVNPAHWEVWKRAELDDRYNMLCPDTISKIPDERLADLGNPAQLRRDAMQSLVGLVSRDVDTVVPMPTDRARGSIEHQTAGLRGKVWGELVRSALQFKSFPIAMFSNHWQRLQSYSGVGGKALYGAEVFATCSILGALSIQLKSLVAGNNPQDMTDPKFAARAMVQGGALSLPGEMLMQWYASPYHEHIADQLGPLFSTASDAYDLGKTIMDTGDPTKKANVGGNVVRLVRGNSGNLWYAKAALDHLIFQRLQDYYSPGYAERMQQRMQKYYNSGQWWKPSTASQVTTPQAPDLSAAVGGGR